MSLLKKIKNLLIYQPKIVVIGDTNFFNKVHPLITSVSEDLSIVNYKKTELKKIKKHNFRDSVITLLQDGYGEQVTVVMCCDSGSVKRDQSSWDELQARITYGINFYRSFMTSKTRDSFVENKLIDMAKAYLPKSRLEIKVVNGGVLISGVVNEHEKLDAFYSSVRKNAQVVEIYDHNLIKGV